jgi:hypothetical protein
VLLNPAKLWPVLDAATSSIKADGGLSSLGALYDLTQDLRGIPSPDVEFLTAPRRPYRYDSDRDEFVQPQTTQLFTALRDDRPIAVRPPGSAPTAAASPSAGAGSNQATASPSASAAPTFEGRTADVDACAQH